MMDPIFSYKHTVFLRTPPEAVRKLNQAYGYPDGNCNRLVDGQIVGNEGDEELQAATWEITKTDTVTLVADVRKDGSRTWRIENA